MKTRDRILDTSLHLFNDEGEQNVTTVDIANEMDISPGNLYYHFRGKDVIIEELFCDFELEMKSILAAPADKPLNLEDHWLFCVCRGERSPQRNRSTLHNSDGIAGPLTLATDLPPETKINQNPAVSY